MKQEQDVQELWRHLIVEGEPDLRRYRRLFRFLPSEQRCKFCNVPFNGVGGYISHLLLHKRPSNLNPNFCNVCENLAENNPGGAEVEVTLLFADVRGSTKLAEEMTPSEFSQLMNRFYQVATKVMMNTDGMIDKFVGDEVVALYASGFAGTDFPSKAVEGAMRLLQATGHEDRNGPWLPVGVGIHTGISFVGSVGSEGVVSITALGDAVNTAARLASNAATGEILISDATFQAAKIELRDLEKRELKVKGRDEPVGVHVLEITPE